MTPLNKRCKFCPGGGLLTQHGLCTDPFGDRGECYCWASNSLHRLQHEIWDDDDMREGADGLGSSRQAVAWEEDAQLAAKHAAQIGNPI